MRRRLIGGVMAAMLVIGLMPTSVWAEDPGVSVNAGDAVDFSDPDFQKLINNTLRRAEDTVITTADMESIEYLSISGLSAVEDIDGIQYAVNLRTLNMTGDIKNVDKIKGLTNLRRLTINSNEFLTDLSQLGSKPELTLLNVASCTELTSLDGITVENYPKLEELSCSRCTALNDISALSGVEIPTLIAADFEDCAIADISPLKGYTLIEELELEKVEITGENREAYKETVSSMTGLETLYMPYCDITDEDTEMFSTLKKLQTLVLNMNKLTSTEFCDKLPADIKVLGLLDNDIGSMDNLGRLTQLKILSLGDNKITDFTFISKLKSLTNETIRHEDGTEDFPSREFYSYGSQSSPIESGNGQIVIANPYIGVDGKPISFEGAEIASNEDAGVTVSYDETANTITLGNIPVSTAVNSIVIKAQYKLPLPNGEYKIIEPRIETFVKAKTFYVIHYDWGADAPSGQILPSDNTEYQTLEAAKAAVDQTFTSQTTVKGEKDGKEGIWTFSGWTVTVNGRTVNAKGSWSFEESHQHNWGTPTYTWSADGKTCTAERVCTEDSGHVESEQAAVSGEVTKPATCTEKGETTYTAVFESDWAVTQTKVLEDVEMLPHSYGAEWESDETGHWHMCAVCKAKADEESHTFEWIVDKEATDTQAGSRHQECTVCGYALAAVEIPPLEKPEEPEQPIPPQTEKPAAQPSRSTTPQTGDAGNTLPWALLCVAAAGVGTAFYTKRKQED